MWKTYEDGNRPWAGNPRVGVGPKQVGRCSLEEKCKEDFWRLREDKMRLT